MKPFLRPKANVCFQNIRKTPPYKRLQRNRTTLRHNYNVEKEVIYYKLLWTNPRHSAIKTERNTHRPFSMLLVMCFIKKLSLEGFSR